MKGGVILKTVPSGISISSDDIIAIMTAFELVDLYPMDDENQAMINRLCCKSASSKLLTQERAFAPNELRMISVAVTCAFEYLSGHLPELLVPPALKSKLSPHFFTYNRLSKEFEKMIEDRHLR